MLSLHHFNGLFPVLCHIDLHLIRCHKSLRHLAVHLIVIHHKNGSLRSGKVHILFHRTLINQLLVIDQLTEIQAVQWFIDNGNILSCNILQHRILQHTKHTVTIMQAFPLLFRNGLYGIRDQKISLFSGFFSPLRAENLISPCHCRNLFLYYRIDNAKRDPAFLSGILHARRRLGINQLLGQTEIEGTSLSVHTLNPDFTVHQFHQLLADCKAKSGSLLASVLFGVHLLEGSKQLSNIFLLDSLSGILHFKLQVNALLAAFFHTYLKLHESAVRKFNCVVHKIDDNLPQTLTIPVQLGRHLGIDVI